MSVNESMSNLLFCLQKTLNSQCSKTPTAYFLHILMLIAWKRRKCTIRLFKHVLQEGFMDALFICESKFNNKIIKNVVLAHISHLSSKM